MSEDEKKQKFPYHSVIFILAEKNRRVISKHNIKNRKEHLELLKKARDKGYILYHADVQNIDGKWYTCPQWIVDWESIADVTHEEQELDHTPEQEAKNEAKLPTEISCPFCDKKMTSTPGRTLHVKSAHPEKYQEYIETK
jgi:hypothetical protein